MGTATQIRNYRVRAGKSAAEVAQRLGINDAWYGDLERDDDEFASTLSLFQAIDLASVLGVGLHDLLGVDALPEERIPLTDLPSRIKAHVAAHGMTLEQFEEKAGWELDDFLQSPLKSAAESPLLFLQAVARLLGIDWLALVPDEAVD